MTSSHLNRSKAIRLLLALILVALLLPVLGCSDPPRRLELEFQAYLQETLDSLDLGLPSGYSRPLYSLVLRRESSEFAPRVIAELHCGYDVPESVFSHWSAKHDLRYIGDLVVGFARQQEWSNSYYLYVTLWGAFRVTYDYEKDQLWLPRDVELLEQVYREFGTLGLHKIAETHEGRDFLKRHGFARERHGEFEIDWMGRGHAAFYPEKTVRIHEDGKFYD